MTQPSDPFERISAHSARLEAFTRGDEETMRLYDSTFTPRELLDGALGTLLNISTQVLGTCAYKNASAWGATIATQFPYDLSVTLFDIFHAQLQRITHDGCSEEHGCHSVYQYPMEIYAPHNAHHVLSVVDVFIATHFHTTLKSHVPPHQEHSLDQALARIRRAVMEHRSSDIE